MVNAIHEFFQFQNLTAMKTSLVTNEFHLYV